MIAHVFGMVAEKFNDSIVVDTGGVGYEIYVAASDFERFSLIESFEEGRLFGAGWLRQFGSVPNEYLHYYYFARETRRADEAVEATRGVFLAAQQRDFYARAATLPGPEAYALWEATRLRREETYMASNRLAAGGVERDAADLFVDRKSVV